MGGCYNIIDLDCFFVKLGNWYYIYNVYMYV